MALARMAEPQEPTAREPRTDDEPSPAVLTPQPDAVTASSSYLPGLDGVRALAVLAVLLFHAGVSWLPGGFLGVDVFFAISGYIITLGLLREHAERGRIDIGWFWVRRARRLLPGAGALIAVLGAFVVLGHAEEAARFRREGLASLAYVTNWYLIFADEPYFETFGRPSLLRHLWSLAVEAQFYVVWPLALSAALGWMRSRYAGALTLALAACSMAWMGVLHAQEADAATLYYRTDTRIGALLLGAALAFAWQPAPVSAGWLSGRRRVVDLLGVVAVAGLMALVWRMDESQALLYRGGFAAAAVASAILIVAAVHPRAFVGRVIGNRVFRWVGVRSYAIYLWHWPVLAFTRPGIDVPLDGWDLVALQVAITTVLADLSYRLVELPARRGAIGRRWSAVRARRWHPVSRQGLASIAYAGCAAIALGALAGGLLLAREQSAPPYLALGRVSIPPSANAAAREPDQAHGLAMAWAWFGQMASERRAGGAAGVVVTTSPVAPPAAVPPAAPVAHRDGPSYASSSLPDGQPARTPVRRATVTAIGDSVMLGAAQGLASLGDVAVDAEVGRHVDATIDLIVELSADGRLGDIVVVQFGHNGKLTDADIDAVMAGAGPERTVVFLTLRVPREWETANNEIIARGAARYENARVADWHALSEGHGELFYDDRTHLRPAGVNLYVDLVRRTIGG